MVPTHLQKRQDCHLEALKAEIERCLEKEMQLAIEERQERAFQLGIDLETEKKKLELLPTS